MRHLRVQPATRMPRRARKPTEPDGRSDLVQHSFYGLNGRSGQVTAVEALLDRVTLMGRLAPVAGAANAIRQSSGCGGSLIGKHAHGDRNGNAPARRSCRSLRRLDLVPGERATTDMLPIRRDPMQGTMD